jgi:hypothetical protein
MTHNATEIQEQIEIKKTCSNLLDDSLNNTCIDDPIKKKDTQNECEYFYCIHVEGDPDFKMKGHTARKGNVKAEFTPLGWVFQKKEDAEEVAKRWTKGKRVLTVFLNLISITNPILFNILYNIWNGTKDEVIVARRQLKLELERYKLNGERKEIEESCDAGGLKPYWLKFKELPDLYKQFPTEQDRLANPAYKEWTEKEKKLHSFYKPAWDKTFEKEEVINLRTHDNLDEQEDINESKQLAISTPEKTIEILPGKTHEMTDKAEKVLSDNNLGIFQRGGQLVRIIVERNKPKKDKIYDREGIEIIKRSADALLISEVDSIYLTELLGKHLTWTRYDERKQSLVLKDPPERIAKTLIARREWNFPFLTGIIQAPTLRSNGTILENPGYDEQTGLYFNSGNISFPPIPHHPSKEDAIKSLQMLLKILEGFPFENDESKSVSISAILTAIIRKSIRTAPLHGYTAPKMASGKSLLADVVGLIACGQSNSAIPQAENEAEEKKRLLAVLAEGDSIICYDNIERPFGSAALCSVLTQENFKERLLGLNKTLNVPTNATFLATGNNLTFVGDTSTRAILCRLDPKCERPEDRSFDIDLRNYIPNNRVELVIACLTILRAYHVAGRPKQDIKQFGRFEDWSDWVRSSLIWLGMADPCESRKEIENADPVRMSLGELLLSWHDYLGDFSFRIKDVVKKAENDQSEQAQNLLDVLKDLSKGHGDINIRSLGNKFAEFKGRFENGYCLEKAGKYQNADMWRVKKTTETQKIG